MSEQAEHSAIGQGWDNVLFQFLRNIHHKTLMPYTKEQTEDLELGVKEIVQKIIDTFYKGGEYEFENMIHVGSSYEGSKIISPDEFDFMLVLKHLSEEGRILIDTGCQPGMKLLRHKEFGRSESSGPNLVFNNLFGLPMNSEMTNSEAKRVKQKLITVQTELGELRIKDMLRYTLYLECVNTDRKFDITVDLMPSVKIPCNTKEVQRDMKMCPEEIKGLAFRDGCFLVGKFCVIDGMCWQLSFAAAERNMMKSLSPGHMKIYRVLKYLFVGKSIVGICDLISSYVLKTTVLRHAYLQCAKESKPTECFVAILRSLAAAMASAFMKSLFLPSLNLWQRVIQEKMRNITENETICDKYVKEQLTHIITVEGRDLKDALTITVVFDFWKRIFLLLAAIFERAEHELMTKESLEQGLRIVYSKLNEDDEDDDLDKDYFSDENTDYKTPDAEWKIFLSSINIQQISDCDTENCATSFIDSDKVTDQTACSVDDVGAKENDETFEEESQDLKDIETFVDTFMKETGEPFESDDESDLDSDEYCSGEEDSWDEDKMFVQAEQEDVYMLYEKYKTDIGAVNIPVFTDLLGQISKSTCCRCFQDVKDNFKAGECASASDICTGDVKRRKLSCD